MSLRPRLPRSPRVDLRPRPRGVELGRVSKLWCWTVLKPLTVLFANAARFSAAVGIAGAVLLSWSSFSSSSFIAF